MNENIDQQELFIFIAPLICLMQPRELIIVAQVSYIASRDRPRSQSAAVDTCAPQYQIRRNVDELSVIAADQIRRQEEFRRLCQQPSGLTAQHAMAVGSNE